MSAARGAARGHALNCAQEHRGPDHEVLDKSAASRSGTGCCRSTRASAGQRPGGSLAALNAWLDPVNFSSRLPGLTAISL